MTQARRISTYALRLLCSICLFFAATSTQAQGFWKLERDSVPMFRGFAVSGDLVGAVQLLVSDYGQLEGAFRVNLHDQYFPTVEVGYGKASHEDDQVTGITYKTQAPFFRLGVDVNIMKKKHTGNRIFAGVRYGYTNYKVDIARRPFEEPTWKWETSFGVKDEACYQHWAELLFGIDAKVFGPLHLGWSVRYRQRLMHNDGQMGNVWYVPGFGKQSSSVITAQFNVIIDI